MTLKSLSQYGPHFQVKVLHSLLKNKKFTLNIRDVILPSYFENEAHKWIVREALQYFDKFHNTPTLDFLKIEVKKLENEVLKTAIVEQLKERVWEDYKKVPNCDFQGWFEGLSPVEKTAWEVKFDEIQEKNERK